MGKTETVEVLIEGGKASPAPPLGTSLGPLKVNVKAIVDDINKRTEDFRGMKVPVKIEVDTETKAFSISIGTPPVSQLIKKEMNLKTASGEPNKLKCGVLGIEHIIKLAKMKRDAFQGDSPKSHVKTVLGTCQSMGVLIDGKDAKTVIDEVSAGKYDNLISSGKTEVSVEKQKELTEMRKSIEEKVKEYLKQKTAEKAMKEAEAVKKAAAAPTEVKEGAAAPVAAKAAPAKKK